MFIKRKKVILVLGSLLLALTPLSSFATQVAVPISVETEEEIMPISLPIEGEDVKDYQYIRFTGKIEEIDNSENFRILVKRDVEEGLDALWAYINEDVLLLKDSTTDVMEKTDLLLGMEISVIYHKDTMMALSYPPLLGPDVVVVHEKGDHDFVLVERFDENLLSYDKYLILNLGEDTIIVDENGDEYHGELFNRDLVVFYSFIAKSLPAQTTPHKIIVLDEEEVISEVILEEDMVIHKDDLILIPLRYVAEGLGYEVTWNNDTRTVEILKGTHWSLLTIGENNYNFAKMIVKLEKEPIIINSRTFVPISFVEKILQGQFDLLDDGNILIRQ